MTKRLYVPDHVIKERQAANEAQTQKKKDL